MYWLTRLPSSSRKMELLIRFLVFFCLMITVSAKETVPVLVWTNDGSVVFPQQLAGHSINQHGFRKSFVDGLASNQKDNIVLFMQDKLSLTDFTRFTDVYGTDEEPDSFSNIKSLMSEMTSTFLPSVASPTPALLELKDQTSRKIRTIDDPQDLSLNSDDDGPQLIVVKLPELQHSPKSLGHLDKIVGLVTAKMRALSRPFIAFYTASTLAHHGSSVKGHHHSRRLMSTSDEASGVFINVSDSFYFYSRNISLMSNGNSTVLENIEVDDRSECNDTGDDCTVMLKFPSMLMSSMPIVSPSLMMQFNRTTGINTGYWYLSRFVLSYWNTTLFENTTADPMSSDVSIEYSTNFVEQTPFGYSYHCYKLPVLVVKNATGVDTGSAPMIYLDNFQVQAFIIQNGRFGHYNDCIGFFTVGIWMFLISSVVLLAVLFFGIIMILNLTTMDRFDDAKGKTISVNTSD